MKQWMNKEKKSDTAWHRLDNVGNLFPLISNSNLSNVFRVAVQLNNPIDPELLQKALTETLPWFSHFQFRLRRGFFWNYFEKNNQPMIEVEEESGRPCSFIEASKNQHYLFKVLYYNNRITLEVFHALTDGTGAVQFLKALVMNYLSKQKGESLCIDSEVAEVLSNTEDGYRTHYKKQKINEKVIKNGYHIKGRKLPMFEMGVIHGFLDLKEVLDYCKTKQVSLTIYLVSVYIWSIYKARHLEGTKHKPIQIAVPVNLRRFFDTNTTMNFFSYITANLLGSDKEFEFDDVLTFVKNQFQKQITKDNFAAKIGKDVALRRNPFVRTIPLFIKNIFVKSIYMSSIRAYTSTMSNIGPVSLPKGYVSDIQHFEFLLNPTLADPVKAAVCSFENTLVISITSQLIATDVQKEFFRKLTADGMSVNIESNGVYYENM